MPNYTLILIYDDLVCVIYLLNKANDTTTLEGKVSTKKPLTVIPPTGPYYHEKTTAHKNL